MAFFTVSIESDFYDLWRYNIVVMASVMRDGEQTEVLKHRSEIAPVGAELQMKPLDYNPDRAIHLQSGEADALTLYIYIIPHTLPMTTDVAEATPFEMSVEVFHGAEQPYRKRVEVNQWSGENLEIRV